eukprot:scaffold224196_cov32-Tisochrysis_lutea.AAC.3
MLVRMPWPAFAGLHELGSSGGGGLAERGWRRAIEPHVLQRLMCLEARLVRPDWACMLRLCCRSRRAANIECAHEVSYAAVSLALGRRGRPAPRFCLVRQLQLRERDRLAVAAHRA